MRSTLIHYHVADYLTPNSKFLSLASIASVLMYREFPLAHFSPYQVSVSERRINWVQSFARRGFDFADYWSRNGYTLRPGPYHFFRTPQASGPQSLEFTGSGDSDSPLQGDLVTYVVTETGFFLESIAVVEDALRASCLRDLLGDSEVGVQSRWWMDRTALTALSRQVTQRMAEVWKDAVLDAWTRRSLVHLSYQAH